MEELVKVANMFDIGAPAVGAVPYGCGHINDTYKVTCADGTLYVLQRINNNVFRDVEGLMRNVKGVTEYIGRKAVLGGTSASDILRLIPANGAAYVKTDGGYYRMYNFISSGVSIETKATESELRASAKGFGMFQKLLDGYPTEELTDTIPNFHNTEWRYTELERAIREDRANRLAEVMAEVDWFVSRKRYASAITSLLRSGAIPERVTHNDTKLNNVLINVKTMQPVAVIDLDTVMKGAMAYDFGDSIRSGATTGAEDEKDLSLVNFDINLYRAYTEGFLSEVGERLVKAEAESLHLGAILMTYECGMRFLTDYLDGDVYFKIKRSEHNLDRARTQMKLVEGMERAEGEMKKIVEECLA